MIDTRCRVTVVGVKNRVDIAIPAEAPIAEYNDQLARMCGQQEDDALPPVWSLAPVGAPAFPLTSSLASEGIEDGAVLYLRDTLSGEDREPVVRSVWEVVSELAQKSRRVRWDVQSASRVAVLLGAYWLAASLWYLGLAGQRSHSLAVIAGFAGIGLAALARLLGQYPRVLPGSLRTWFGCAAIPCMVLVAVLAPGEPAFDLTHLVYFEVGLLLGFMVALVAVPDVLLGAVTLLVGIGGILIAILATLHAPALATAATVVVAGVLFLAVAPRTAGMLVAVSWLSMSSATLEPDADPDQLGARVLLAHRVLVLLVSLNSVATGVALVVLAGSSGPLALAVAVVATIVLFLRTTTFELASEAIAPLIAGVAGVFGLLTALARGTVAGAVVMPLFIAVGMLAVGVGLPMLLWGTGRAPVAADDRSSKLGPLLTIAQIVLPALLLGVYGLYATLWNLGR